LILVAIVVLFGGTLYLVSQLRVTRAELARAHTKLQSHEEQLAKLEGSVARTYQQAEQNISTLRGEVSTTRGQIQQATSKVKTEVLSHTEQVAQRLSAAQKATAAKERGELEQQLKNVASTADTKLGAVSADVGTVRSEVSATKDELRKTIAELKSVRGDLGVQSGLIATNAGELAALKRLGERNYFEFDLKKSKQPQRVGTVSMKLKSADTKRNRYTLEVIADDKLTEKKDRTINEPVQFYVAKARIPYEIVVNQVAKDRIVGYMATPKEQGR
jgi:chromosome segregation ATPase